MNANARMMQLVHSFPSLRGFTGPWDALDFEAWSLGAHMTHGSAHAARFVLSVWNADQRYRLGAFNVVKAFGTFDSAHRAAFLAWCNDPFFP